jgi:predicted negative regulator of RcsB-dependent stress response
LTFRFLFGETDVEAYTPDDQVARLKAWWNQYGTSLIVGVAIGVLVLGGLKYWQQHRIQRAESASPLYQTLLSDMASGRNDQAAAAATKLMQEYDGTPYAGKAALLLARLRFDAGDLAGARQHLEWAMNKASETAVQHSARLRLGRMLLDQKDLDGALALTSIKDRAGFESEYEELRGDALSAKGDRKGAYQAYQAALDKLPSGSGYGRLLTMKRDNVSPGVGS